MLRVIIAIVAIIAAVFIFRHFSTPGSDLSQRITFTTQQGDLRVTVLEGGNIEALESQEIRSEIKGRNGAKIMSIVEEGYLVTQEDIDNELVLVELETSTLEDELVNQEISTQTAEASYTERKAQFDIQINLNQSTISTAEQNVKFTRMDFEKYLGEKAVNEIISTLEMAKYFKSDDETQESTTPSTPDKQTLKVKPAPLDAAKPGAEKIEESKGDPEVPKERRRSEGRSQRGQRGEGGDGEGRSRRGGGGGRGFDPASIKAMIDANGGEIPAAMKERMEAMGISEADLQKFINGGPKKPVAPEEVAVVPPEQFSSALPDEYLEARAAIDFSEYANSLKDGEALQMLRKLESDSLVAVQDAQLAKSRLDGQVRLSNKNFITKTDLELEKVKYKKAVIRVESTKTDRELYIKYTFPKMAEKLFSDYEEALMNLQRKKKEAYSKMAQEHARLTASERKYNLEKQELDDIHDQLTKCTIRALRPGLVVYGSSTNKSPWRRSNEEPIQEGTTLRERQRIITIPDMTKMGVKVDIHESAVQKVAIGQSVSISIDAFPGRILEGEVIKVAVLADSANAFMNPDLKVYPTVIALKGTHDWLRPGMSAEVEILIEELDDVTYIPIQAVTYEGDKQICYVKSGLGVETREITLGSFTDEFIEIKSGLEPGEEVLMLIPGSNSSDSDEESQSESPAEAPGVA